MSAVFNPVAALLSAVASDPNIDPAFALSLEELREQEEQAVDDSERPNDKPDAPTTGFL